MKQKAITTYKITVIATNLLEQENLQVAITPLSKTYKLVGEGLIATNGIKNSVNNEINLIHTGINSISFIVFIENMPEDVEYIAIIISTYNNKQLYNCTPFSIELTNLTTNAISTEIIDNIKLPNTITILAGMLAKNKNWNFKKTIKEVHVDIGRLIEYLGFPKFCDSTMNFIIENHENHVMKTIHEDEPIRVVLSITNNNAINLITKEYFKLGAFYVLKNGKKGVIQSLGNLTSEFITVELQQNAETIYIKNMLEISMMVIFSYTEEPYSFDSCNLNVILTHGTNDIIQSTLSANTNNSGFCSLFYLTNIDSNVSIYFKGEMFYDHEEASLFYQFGGTWATEQPLYWKHNF